ncbi:UNVERIFIED_CONTAM: hypothetical protein FKN15_024353 [Acipenser sinensis]
MLWSWSGQYVWSGKDAKNTPEVNILTDPSYSQPILQVNLVLGLFFFLFIIIVLLYDAVCISKEARRRLAAIAALRSKKNRTKHNRPDPELFTTFAASGVASVPNVGEVPVSKVEAEGGKRKKGGESEGELPGIPEKAALDQHLTLPGYPIHFAMGKGIAKHFQKHQGSDNSVCFPGLSDASVEILPGFSPSAVQSRELESVAHSLVKKTLSTSAVIMQDEEPENSTQGQHPEHSQQLQQAPGSTDCIPPAASQPQGAGCTAETESAFRWAQARGGSGPGAGQSQDSSPAAHEIRVRAFQKGLQLAHPNRQDHRSSDAEQWKEGRDGERGMRGSVVTYGYIEKANVKTVSSPYLSSRHPDKKLQEEPVCVENQGLFPSPSPKLVHPGSTSSHPATSPGLLCKTLTSIAKAATSRDLEEFGSPQLRRRAATQDRIPANTPETETARPQPLCPIRNSTQGQHPEHSQQLQQAPGSTDCIPPAASQPQGAGCTAETESAFRWAQARGGSGPGAGQSQDSSPAAHKIRVRAVQKGLQLAHPNRQDHRSSDAEQWKEGRDGERGMRGSVVTYSYIEKANVKTVSSPYLSSRHPDKKLQEEPVCVENQGLFPSPSPKLVHPGSASSHPATSPGLLCKTLTSIAKAATSRALEEFGSPQLRRRAATQVGYQQTQQNRQPRCQFWTGSPVLLEHNNPRMPRSSCTLPRSPASDQLSSQGQGADSQEPPSQGMTLPSQVQQCWMGRESPRLASKLSPALETGQGRPASILHHSPQLQASSKSPRLCHRVNFKLGDSGPTEGGGGHISPANSPKVAHKLAQEASKLSSIFQARNSPSLTPPLDSPRMDAHKLGRPVSPAAGPQHSQYSQQRVDLQKTELEHSNDSAVGSASLRQQRSDTQGTDSLKPGHNAGTVSTVRPAKKSPGVSARQQQRCKRLERDSPKPWRHPVGQLGDTGGADSPNIQNQYVEDRGSSGAGMRQREDAPSPKAGQHVGQCPSRGSPVMNAKQGDSLNLRTGQEGQRDSPRLGHRPGQCEGQASPRRGGRDSVVSSGQQTGQTGALHISQESKTSRKKTRRENSNSQLVSLSCSFVPSMHSQRVALAKWEFLFGTVSEDSAATGVKDPQYSTTHPSVDSSSDSRPALAPPRSLALRGGGEALANHSVQHVEVELVTPPPAVGGSCLCTGIIRRTLQYSETDLDAVPLRCYRETNIDELLAEQDEADSAFGSNRSVIGTSEEEEGGWGDRKYRRAAPEEEKMFTLGLDRLSSQSSLGATLKSPIDIPAPRHASEEGLDTFSRHFESIMESHRAKGTSYSSLDSEDLLSSSQTVFTFDLPTLTPEIQGLICQSARLIELRFAPLAPGETPGMSTTDSAHTRTDSAHTTAPDSSGEEGTAGNTSSERPPTLDSDPESDLIERMCLGSTDTLTNGSRADRNSAKRLAKRLYSLDGFKKSDVARHLSKNISRTLIAMSVCVNRIKNNAVPVPVCLRAFLREFALMGETQERERVLAHFSRRYLACNPNVIPSDDGVHTLTCALMLLNTDLHGHVSEGEERQGERNDRGEKSERESGRRGGRERGFSYNIGKRMTCPQFISNLEGLNDGANFPKDLLKVSGNYPGNLIFLLCWV